MVYRGKIAVLAACFLVLCPFVEVAKKGKSHLIENIEDVKEHKKLLRTRNNVLIVYVKSGSSLTSSQMEILGNVADEIRGTGTIALVDCSESKKLCKKVKSSAIDVELKHYKDGDFNKDYDRKFAVKSMVNFMRDPTGDIPWEEDPTASDVVHIDDKGALTKILAKQKQPMLIMFYAPWCGFCKKLKPDYAQAATELKGEAIMAGMDVDRSENIAVRTEYNITGFPTLYYFVGGKVKYKFGGQQNKEGLVTWMRDPGPPKEPEKEPEWADEESEVVHLTDGSFDEFIANNPSVLVMFYAPWCGHCKQMKPGYTEAANEMKEEEITGVLAAVDATKETALGEKYKIQGFPTVKYFKDGEFQFDLNERSGSKIKEFMKDPKEPPPPPPPEPEWHETESEVVHLTDESFKSFLRKKKHSIVMFYAPWCGHCKKAKPEFTNAAEKFIDDNKVAFAAIDCTTHRDSCGQHDVTAYPTFKYFNYGKNDQKYTGGREESDFVNFMKDPSNPMASMPPPPPSPETHWTDVEGAEDIHHLTETNFDSFIKEHESVLVMFYAPWCGHCKAMKPAYGEVARKLKEENVNGVVAAVEATTERNLAGRFEVRSYPTIKYFKNGEFSFDYKQARKTDDLLKFMKNPVNIPPPPPEPKWSDVPSAINHLTQSTYKDFLADKEVLVMFYAPWCGHCKRSKPDFQDAADVSKGKHFAAVDCTSEQDICSDEEIKGFPAFKFYSKGEYVENYMGDRTKDAFVQYMQEQSVKTSEQGATESKRKDQEGKKDEL